MFFAGTLKLGPWASTLLLGCFSKCSFKKKLLKHASLAASSLCPDGSTPVPGGFSIADPSMDFMFYRLTNNWMSFADIVAACEMDGATLAGIDSPAQKTITRNFIDAIGDVGKKITVLLSSFGSLREKDSLKVAGLS